jgi:hypothetical protein
VLGRLLAVCRTHVPGGASAGSRASSRDRHAPTPRPATSPPHRQTTCAQPHPELRRHAQCRRLRTPVPNSYGSWSPKRAAGSRYWLDASLPTACCPSDLPSVGVVAPLVPAKPHVSPSPAAPNRLQCWHRCGGGVGGGGGGGGGGGTESVFLARTTY